MKGRLEEVRLWVEAGFPVKQATQALDLARSLYYYHRMPHKEGEAAKRGRSFPGYSINQAGEKVCDKQIEEFLTEAIEGEAGVYGYRKLTHYLKMKYRLIINHKKVYRLCHQLHLLLPQREKTARHPRKIARQHEITGSNQLWQVDIKYGSIAESGRFFFLASAIDVFDRSIVGYYHGSTCQAVNITKMLREALISRQIPQAPDDKEAFRLIIRTDNGPQFVSHSFEDFCVAEQLYHERIPNKSPNYNAYIESFHSALERECYQQHTFEFFEEAYYCIDEYVQFYNERRYHGSLNYLAPQQFYRRQLNQTNLDMAISL